VAGVVAGVVAGLVALLAGGASLRGLPRLTLANTGMRIDHSATTVLLALLAAGGAAVLAYALRARPLRLGASLLAAAFLLVALDLWAYRIDIDDRGLSARLPLSSRHLEWRDVTKVDAEADHLTLLSQKGESLSVTTRALSPEQRASLERAIARRLRDAPPAAK
jgi:hypothetical protein